MIGGYYQDSNMIGGYYQDGNMIGGSRRQTFQTGQGVHAQANIH